MNYIVGYNYCYDSMGYRYRKAVQAKDKAEAIEKVKKMVAEENDMNHEDWEDTILDLGDEVVSIGSDIKSIPLGDYYVLKEYLN